LLSDEWWEVFEFLVSIAGIRWYRFVEEKLGFEEGEIEHGKITSKQLFYKIATANHKINNREMWVRVLNNFDLVFIPDDVEFDEEGWVSVGWLYYVIREFVRENVDKVLEKYDEMR